MSSCHIIVWAGCLLPVKLAWLSRRVRSRRKGCPSSHTPFTLLLPAAVSCSSYMPC